MHFRSVLHILGTLLLVLGGFLTVPLVVALVSDDSRLPLGRDEGLGFVSAITLALLAGGALRTLFKVDYSRVGNREGTAVVTLTWIAFSLVGCLPFVITGACGFSDAYFETMSGFTTTGASIFARLDHLPRGLMFWRCQTQWIGGMGIVVFSVAILPFLGIGGYRMFKAELPGGATFQRDAPRIRDTAKALWIMYLALSVAEVLLLLLGGMGLFDAVCHTFATMSTGGYSTRGQSVGAWPSPMVQWVVVVFMFLGGGNFSLYQQVALGQVRKVLRDEELRVYTGLTVLVVALVALLGWQAEALKGGPEAIVRTAAFQVVSIGTTTGFATCDFNHWPDASRLLLLLIMFVGGCSGSTGGGMKVVRLVIAFKASIVELRRAIAPRAVQVVRTSGRPLATDLIANVMAFLAMYMGLFILGTLALVLLGLDLLSASSGIAANLGNVGPGLGTVGPAASYADVPLAGKWILVGCQLLGRLEIYSVLVLLLRRTWVR